jgi:hypothetical protein
MIGSDIQDMYEDIHSCIHTRIHTYEAGDQQRRPGRVHTFTHMHTYVTRGAKLVIGSDVQDVYEDMMMVLGNNTKLREIEGSKSQWPLERMTERQLSCLGRGEVLYHCVFERV